MRKLFYRIFKCYKVLETRCFTWEEADLIIKQTHDKPESERWVIAKEEDTNHVIGIVWLCRKVRITE